MDDLRSEKLVKGAESASRKDQLPTDLRIATAHEAKQLNLLLGMRRKIGMAAFGRHDTVAAGIPKQNGFAQPCAGSQQGACTAGFGFARIEDAKVFRGEMLETVPPSPEVVQQDNLRNIEFLDERLGFYDPGKICGAHAAIDDRASDAESRSVNFAAIQMFRSLAREFLDNQIKLRKFLAGKTVPEDRREIAVLFGKQ